jgi:hypothetical protein
MTFTTKSSGAPNDSIDATNPGQRRLSWVVTFLAHEFASRRTSSEARFHT